MADYLNQTNMAQLQQKSTLKIWQQIKNHLNTLPLATPICNNDLCKLVTIGSRCSPLNKHGLCMLVDLYHEGIFARFAHLCTSVLNLQQSDLFQYFQIRHIAQSNTLSFPNAPSSVGIGHLTPVTTMNRRHMSFPYNLLTPDTPSILIKTKTEWEIEPLFQTCCGSVTSSSD